MRRASERFADARYSSTYSSVTLLIELFRKRLPVALRDEVGLCRVFTIRAGARAPHKEIHRNSIQRLVSFRGAGAIHSAHPGSDDQSYRPLPIYNPAQMDAPAISVCWDVVPENTWHFPEARGNEQWFGVVFHGASAETIVDEYVTQFALQDTTG